MVRDISMCARADKILAIFFYCGKIILCRALCAKHDAKNVSGPSLWISARVDIALSGSRLVPGIYSISFLPFSLYSSLLHLDFLLHVFSSVSTVSGSQRPLVKGDSRVLCARDEYIQRTSYV